MLDPVILFFALGFLAGVLKSDLRIPRSFYETLSIYLLLSIGIKGGIELYKSHITEVVSPAAFALITGILLTVIAYAALRYLFRFSIKDACGIAAHYGSVSAVTFAVVLNYCKSNHIPYEEYMTVLLVLMEVPGIATAILLYKFQERESGTNWIKIVCEVFFGKSILLVIGGLFIGYITASMGDKQLNFFFFDLFKGFLSIFMLEMGVVASEKFGELKVYGTKILAFAVLMPLLAACIGIASAQLMGLGTGGHIIFATLCASASYIAAPAAMKMAVPGANVSLSLTAALGITLPFNLIIGIPFYHLLILKLL
ncbi:MAG: sodium-dependent bicarbonate transport family permease [Bacteroidetes bacterium]|nr:sodium-dependent bicarbonate transport family permease [Bacteroidota bacterium]